LGTSCFATQHRHRIFLLSLELLDIHNMTACLTVSAHELAFYGRKHQLSPVLEELYFDIETLMPSWDLFKNSASFELAFVNSVKLKQRTL
jgi:hypothetical protein